MTMTAGGVVGRERLKHMSVRQRSDDEEDMAAADGDNNNNPPPSSSPREGRMVCNDDVTES